MALPVKSHSLPVSESSSVNSGACGFAKNSNSRPSTLLSKALTDFLSHSSQTRPLSHMVDYSALLSQALIASSLGSAVHRQPIYESALRGGIAQLYRGHHTQVCILLFPVSGLVKLLDFRVRPEHTALRIFALPSRKADLVVIHQAEVRAL